MENVIVQTAFLGDLVLAVPLMRQLVAIDPEHPLTVICRKGLGGFVRDLKIANEVIEVDKKNRATWRKQRREILSRQFNHVVCPHGSPRTAALVWKMKASGMKVGFHAPWNGIVFDRRVKKPLQLPDALRQLSLLTAINNTFAEEYSEVGSSQEIWNSDEKSADVDYRKIGLPVWSRLSPFDEPGKSRDADKSKVVLMAPGSVWATKRWSAEGFAEVARKLLANGYAVILTGSPEERALNEEIVRLVPGVENKAGEWSVAESLRAMSESVALIANDSGAIHLAALVGLPTVAIFGPTVLAQGFRPWQRRAIVVQQGLECRPCGRHGHDVCPIGTHACMKELGADRVLAAFGKLVGEFKRA